MKDKVYLICSGKDDDLLIEGVILGTEEKARLWCDRYNEKCQEYYDKVRWEEAKILNESDVEMENL